jgi:4-hydroxy-3-polyprenylbenzoate decarboxylase
VTHRIIIAITGASGAQYGICALQRLRENRDVETHLVLSKAARAVLTAETTWSAARVCDLADVVHANHDLGAAIASGSFRTDGMLIAPCSIKTLSGVANCNDDTLVVRAADVALKERRRLVLLVRETPLHAGHLGLMSAVTAAGGIVMPPVPAFYTKPATAADIVEDTIEHALSLFGLDHGTDRWTGTRSRAGLTAVRLRGPA